MDFVVQNLKWQLQSTDPFENTSSRGSAADIAVTLDA
jgi:hypothetical protein